MFQTEEISYATQWNDYLSITNEIRTFEKGRLLIVHNIHNNICKRISILNILIITSILQWFHRIFTTCD